MSSSPISQSKLAINDEADNHPHYANPYNDNHLDKNGKWIPVDELDLDNLEVLEMMGHSLRAVEKLFIERSPDNFMDFCRELIDDKDYRAHELLAETQTDLSLKDLDNIINTSYKQAEIIMQKNKEIEELKQHIKHLEHSVATYKGYVESGLCSNCIPDENKEIKQLKLVIEDYDIKVNHMEIINKRPNKINYWTALLRDAKQNKLILAKNRPRCKSTHPTKCRRKAEAITSEHANTSSPSGYEFEARKRLDEGNYWWDYCKVCWDKAWFEPSNPASVITYYPFTSKWLENKIPHPDIIPAEILNNVEPEQHDSEPEDDLVPAGNLGEADTNGYVLHHDITGEVLQNAIPQLDGGGDIKPSTQKLVDRLRGGGDDPEVVVEGTCGEVIRNLFPQMAKFQSLLDQRVHIAFERADGNATNGEHDYRQELENILTQNKPYNHKDPQTQLRQRFLIRHTQMTLPAGFTWWWVHRMIDDVDNPDDIKHRPDNPAQFFNKIQKKYPALFKCMRIYDINFLDGKFHELCVPVVEEFKDGAKPDITKFKTFTTTLQSHEANVVPGSNVLDSYWVVGDSGNCPCGYPLVLDDCYGEWNVGVEQLICEGCHIIRKNN